MTNTLLPAPRRLCTACLLFTCLSVCLLVTSHNKIIYKIFGAMAKDSYGQISEYFGIPSVEQLITNRHNIYSSIEKNTYVKH